MSNEFSRPDFSSQANLASATKRSFFNPDDAELAAFIFAFCCLVAPVVIGGAFIFGWLLFF
jgi:hypothetical protein